MLRTWSVFSRSDGKNPEYALLDLGTTHVLLPGDLQPQDARAYDPTIKFAGETLLMNHCRDPSFPSENTKSPRPENPEKLLKNYNLAHPEPVLKITEKLLKRVIF